MTADDLAELERLLAEYRSYFTGEKPKKQPQMTHARRHIETALVRHAEELIEMADFCLRIGDDGCVVDVSLAEVSRAAKRSMVAQTDVPD